MVFPMFTNMADYQAKNGQVDPHGEMTGAITVNMILTMVPVAAWSFYIGHWLLPEHLWIIVTVAIAMSILLPLIFLRLSQRIWAWFSAWLEKL